MYVPTDAATSSLLPPSSQSPGEERKNLPPIVSSIQHTVISIFRPNKRSTVSKNQELLQESQQWSLDFLTDFFRYTTTDGTFFAVNHRQVGPASQRSAHPRETGLRSVIDCFFLEFTFPGARRKPLGTKQQWGEQPALKWRCLTEQREKFAITTTVSVFGVRTRRKG